METIRHIKQNNHRHIGTSPDSSSLGLLQNRKYQESGKFETRNYKLSAISYSEEKANYIRNNQ